MLANSIKQNVVLTCRFDRILSEFGSCHAKPIDLTQDCDSEASLATSSSSEGDSEGECIPQDGHSEDSSRLEATLILFVIAYKVYTCVHYGMGVGDHEVVWW